MRRFDPEQWSGVAMLAVSVAVAGPVLFGATPSTIPRGWWIVLFAVLITALLISGAGERPSKARYAVFVVAVVSCWAVVLTAPHLGLLPVLLVVTAAVSVYVVPLSVGLLVVGLNTAVLAAIFVRQATEITETLIVTGFYLLIQLATLLSTLAHLREQRMRRELATAHVELRAATVLLSESARTAERLRISRELHDAIGHQLTVLTLELEVASHRDVEQARAHTIRANRVARELLADVRTAVGELRTEPLGLAEALGQVVRDLPGLQVSIDVDPNVRVGEDQTTALVRAVQEIVSNTIRHAQAHRVWIDITLEDSSAVLTAVDDGRGARNPVPGNGLRGLTERFAALGGEVIIDGHEGFRVTARVPTP